MLLKKKIYGFDFCFVIVDDNFVFNNKCYVFYFNKLV